MVIELNPAELEALHAASAGGGAPSGQSRAQRVADLERAAAEALSYGSVDDALAIVRAALVHDPRAAKAWAIAAQAYAQSGAVELARRAAERACACDDDDHASFVLCAQLQLKAGDVDAARASASYVLLHSRSDDLRARAERLLESAAAQEPR